MERRKKGIVSKGFKYAEKRSTTNSVQMGGLVTENFAVLKQP